MAATVPPACPFDCIVITAANARQAASYELELQRRVRRGVLPPPSECLLLSVADPNGARVGSGGGTLNALVKAAHALENSSRAIAGRDARVLVVHSGGDSQRSPTQSVCGKAWSALNCVGHGGQLYAPVDLLCQSLFSLLGKGGMPQGGLAVCSCDVMLLLDGDAAAGAAAVAAAAAEASPGKGFCWGLGIRADGSYGPHHGVYIMEDMTQDSPQASNVRTFVQKGSIETLASLNGFYPRTGEVCVDSGVVVFDALATASLLSLSAQPPFNGCVGAAGTHAFRVELYSDIMLALGNNVCQGGRDGYFSMPPTDADSVRMRAGREMLWNSFQGMAFHAFVPSQGSFAHLGTTQELLQMMTLSDPKFIKFARHFGLQELTRCTVPPACLPRSGHSAVVNSILEGQGMVGAGAVVEHSRLADGSSWSVGPNALLSGLRSAFADLHVPSGIVLQETQLARPAKNAPNSVVHVVAVFGVNDAIKGKFALDSTKPAFCQLQWSYVAKVLTQHLSDRCAECFGDLVWPGIEPTGRTLWNARLFVTFDPAAQSTSAQADPLLLLRVARGGNVSPSECRLWADSDRVSFQDILALAEPTGEFAWREFMHNKLHAEGDSTTGERSAKRSKIQPAFPQPCQCDDSSEFCWDVVAVTAKLPAHAEAYREELVRRRASGDAPGLGSHTLLLAVGDPGGQRYRVGSGGATLNALLVIAEHLSELVGANNVEIDSLDGRRIVLLHVGGEAQRVPAFSLFPWSASRSKCSHAASTVDLLLGTMKDLAKGCPKGLFVVTASSTFLGLAPKFCKDFAKAASVGGGAVTALALAVPFSEARQDGIYVLNDVDDNAGTVCEVIYRPDPELMARARLPMAPADNVAKICGVCFFDTDASKTVLRLAFDPAFEPLTYVGVDNGATPLGLGLYLDVLAALGTNARRGSFQEHVARFGGGQVPVVGAMRRQLYDVLHGRLTLRAVVADAAHSEYSFVRSTQEHYRFLLEQIPKRLHHTKEQSARTFVDPAASGSVGTSAIVVNSVVLGSSIGSRALIESSLLEKCSVGEQAIVSGLRRSTLTGLWVPEKICVQQLALILESDNTKHGISGERNCFLVFHLDDDLWSGPSSTTENAPKGFLGQSWSDFFQQSGVRPEELWPTTTEPSKQTLQTAQLYPMVESSCDQDPGMAIVWLKYVQAVLTRPESQSIEALKIWRQSWLQGWRATPRISLAEATSLADVHAELAWQRDVAFKASVLHTQAVLKERRDESLREVIQDVVDCGRWEEYAAKLDQVIIDVRQEDSDIAARALAMVAEVLAAVGGTEGGLRSGCARNLEWRGPLFNLRLGFAAGATDASKSLWHRREAVEAMARIRKRWARDGPTAIIRAARHYEGAAQALIQESVATASRFVTFGKSPSPPDLNVWVKVEAPARVDVAGGWTDTPPLSYEHGGKVTNLAIKVDGKKPIGAKARRTSEPCLMFELAESSDQPFGSSVVRCEKLEDLEDYNAPNAPAALLKAAVLCCEIVRLPELAAVAAGDASNAVVQGVPSLQEQLLARLGGGLHVVSWSALPQGSGLGTSSILAGVIMSAVAEAAGWPLDSTSLVHAVLKVEQMLSTGGGWQDQVGGLWGGAKITRAEAHLPLHVVPEQVPITEACSKALAQHLLLVFTGHPRLAKNLLQNVIRRWYNRLPEICETVGALTTNAESAAEAFREGDIPKLGACLSLYWEHKKQMAAGCEPAAVAAMREILAPHLLGLSLAGAGGGGFMVLITKQPNAASDIKAALLEAAHPVVNVEELSFHTAEPDADGMTVTIEHA